MVLGRLHGPSRADATAGSEMPGHVMIDAGDATAWGFPTGKAVVVSERVLQQSPDIVAHTQQGKINIGTRK